MSQLAICQSPCTLKQSFSGKCSGFQTFPPKDDEWESLPISRCHGDQPWRPHGNLAHLLDHVLFLLCPCSPSWPLLVEMRDLFFPSLLRACWASSWTQQVPCHPLSSARDCHVLSGLACFWHWARMSCSLQHLMSMSQGLHWRHLSLSLIWLQYGYLMKPSWWALSPVKQSILRDLDKEHELFAFCWWQIDFKVTLMMPAFSGSCPCVWCYTTSLKYGWDW